MNMNSISDDSRMADVFANSNTETVVKNIDFSFLLERENTLIDSNLITNSHKNKVDHVPTAMSVDLYEADPGTVTDAVQSENDITKQVITAGTSFIASHVATKVCGFPVKLYCPFCCSNFTSKRRLKGHIKNEHASQLGRVFIHNKTPVLHSCQLCHARFYTDYLVTKHVAQYHQDYVITMFQEEEPNKYIMCGFCPYMVSIKHKQYLLAHVEEKHFKEFKVYIDQKFSQIAQCEKLQYTLHMKNSAIPHLNTLLIQMSIKDNEHNKKGEIDQSESSVTSKFISQNENQLSHEDGSLFYKRKVSGMKYVRPGREVPIRRKLRFDVADVPRYKSFNKENISCSTTMKDVLKCIPESSKQKPVSTWKSLFSFKRKERNSSKPVSKFSTNAPNTFDLETHIAKTQYDKHNLVTKKNSSIKKEKHTSKMYSVTDGGDAGTMHNEDKKIVTSEESYPAVLEVRGCSTCSRTPSVKSLNEFQHAICLNGFVNNIDLVAHKRQQHTGPLKLLQPSYKCGQCAAKFYKNSYLIKHRRFHHTPRCLTNELPA